MDTRCSDTHCFDPYPEGLENLKFIIQWKLNIYVKLRNYGRAYWVQTKNKQVTNLVLIPSMIKKNIKWSKCTIAHSGSYSAIVWCEEDGRVECFTVERNGNSIREFSSIRTHEVIRGDRTRTVEIAVWIRFEVREVCTTHTVTSG